MKITTKILIVLALTTIAFGVVLTRSGVVKAADLNNEGYGWAKITDNGVTAQNQLVVNFYDAATGNPLTPDYIYIQNAEYAYLSAPVIPAVPAYQAQQGYSCGNVFVPPPSCAVTSVTINLPNNQSDYGWIHAVQAKKSGYHFSWWPGNWEQRYVGGHTWTINVYMAPNAFTVPYQTHINFPVDQTWYSYNPTYTILGYPSQAVGAIPAGTSITDNLGVQVGSTSYNSSLGPSVAPFPHTFSFSSIAGPGDGIYGVRDQVIDNTGAISGINTLSLWSPPAAPYVAIGVDSKKPIVDSCTITNPAVGANPPSVPVGQPVTLNFTAHDDTSLTTQVSGIALAQAQWNNGVSGWQTGGITALSFSPALQPASYTGWQMMSAFSPNNYQIRVRVRDLAKNSGGSTTQFSDIMLCGSVNIVSSYFSLSITPPADTTVGRGGTSADYTVTATGAGGFSGNITLTNIDLSTNGITSPTGTANWTFAPNPLVIAVVNGTGTATFAVKTSLSTAFSPPNYTLTVTGTSGALIRTVTTPLTVVISPPTGLNVTYPPCTPGNALPSSSIIFNWTASSGATKYEVRVSDDQNFGAYAIKTDITAVTTDGAKTDGNNWNGPLSLVSGNKLSLTPRTPYYWRVIANDSPGTHTSAPAGYINAGTVPPNSFSVTGFCQYDLSINLSGILHLTNPDGTCDNTDKSAYVYTGGQVLCTVATIKNSDNSNTAAPGNIKIGVWQEGLPTGSYGCDGSTIPGSYGAYNLGSPPPIAEYPPPITTNPIGNPMDLTWAKDTTTNLTVPATGLPPGHSATVNIRFPVNLLKGNYTAGVYVDYDCTNTTEAVYRRSRPDDYPVYCKDVVDPDTGAIITSKISSCITDSFWDNRITFGYHVGGAGWFNTTGGDVGSGTDTTVADISASTQKLVPYTSAISDYLISSSTVGIKSTFGVTSRAWQIKGTDIPAKPLPAFVSRGGIYNYFNQKFRATAQNSPWQACPVPYGVPSAPFGPGYWHCGGTTFTLTGNTDLINGEAVVFVDGDFNIILDGAGTSPDSNKVFLVSGDVNVKPNVTNVEGVYIVGGTFHTDRYADYSSGSAVWRTGTSRNCLTVNGAVYANTISMERTATADAGSTCGAAGSDAAAETFAYDPKYMVNMNSLLGISSTSWQEIAP